MNPQPKKAAAPKPEMKKYVIKSIFVDKYNIVRIRVLLTGCVCEDCGFDFCERNGFPPWDELDDGQRAVVTQAMKEHKKLHTISQHKIITEEEMVQNNLGKPAAL